LSSLGPQDPPSGAPPEEAVPGERGIASVNRTPSIQSRVSSVLAMALMVGLGLGLLTWYYAHTLSRHAHAVESAQSASKSKAQGEMALPSIHIGVPQVLGPKPEPPPAMTLTEVPVDSGNMIAGYTSAPATPGTPPPKTPAELALERRLAGPAFASRETGFQGSPERDPPAPRASGADESEPRGEVGAPAADSRMASLLKPTVTPAVRARVLPTQRLLLPKGAFIDCTLETAIDSTLPGMTTCITATDTFSVDGEVVLLERGSKLVGETQGDVRQGSARVFVLWSEARTPAGIVVPLASPGTDELGRSGLPGQVNNHFWDRFGAAILISIIDGAVQSGVRNTGNGTVIVDPSASTGVMTEVLKSTVNIPPTVVKQNGDRIQVLVARDLDFRSVYELHPVSANHP
jgi:type IV secretion system protein VirB10